MKTAIFEIEDWEKKYFQKNLKEYNITYLKEHLDADSAGKAGKAEIISVFIHSKIDERVLKKLPKLKCIITRSVGYDHIDLRACRSRKISVFNIPDYGTQTVAEHTFALMLALTRKIVDADEKTKKGNFDIKELEGTDISGKTLGVVGTGRIGQAVIKIARVFGMRVLAYDIMRNEKTARTLGFSYTSLPDLLSSADIVTLHTPLTHQTNHIINSSAINSMKKGAYLINTARGQLVETRALLSALDSGKIAGAGLDVLEGEQNIEEEHELLKCNRMDKKCAINLVIAHDLMRHEKVLVTPHIAFYTKEALERILDKTCSVIKRFEEGDRKGALI